MDNLDDLLDQMKSRERRIEEFRRRWNFESSDSSEETNGSLFANTSSDSDGDIEEAVEDFNSRKRQDFGFCSNLSTLESANLAYTSRLRRISQQYHGTEEYASDTIMWRSTFLRPTPTRVPGALLTGTGNDELTPNRSSATTRRRNLADEQRREVAVCGHERISLGQCLKKLLWSILRVTIVFFLGVLFGKLIFSEGPTAGEPKYIRARMGAFLGQGNQKLQWTTVNSARDPNLIPLKGVMVGNEHYIIRAVAVLGCTAIIPGKYDISQWNAYIGFEGMEYAVTEFQFLDRTKPTIKWVAIRDGADISSTKAPVAGYHPKTHQPLYICQTDLGYYLAPVKGKYEEFTVPGYYDNQRKACFVTYNGKQVPSTVAYKVLEIVD